MISKAVIDRLRLALIGACAIAVVPLGFRASEVAAEVGREHIGEVAFQQGMALYRAGRFDEAADSFQFAMLNAPQLPEVYRGFAEAEFKRGHIDNAIAAYRKLLSMYPYTYVPPYYLEVAMIEMSANRYQDAREDLLTAAALEPNEWRPYFFLGICYRRLGDLGSARAAWQRVLALNSDNQYARDELRKLDRARP